MNKITPFLWFDGQAEEAMEFYTSIFKDSSIGEISRYSDAGPGKPGSVMTASFTLNGLEFTALNGGPEFKFNESVSFSVDCKDQAEVDYYWDRLTEGGGEPGPCGWLKDKFGLSWQIVPSRLNELLQDSDPVKAGSVMRAMLEMHKINIAELEQAYETA
jgi:predicted 3-demethylubiquinone-9 3-methyltransferase (glyoxalase superfamily)